MRPDGIVYRTLAAYSRLVAANLGWLLVSCTVVGAPPATVALFAQLQRRGALGWRGYWAVFRGAIGPSYALAALWGIPIAVVAALCAVASATRSPLPLGAAGVVLCCLVAAGLHSGPAAVSAGSVRSAVRETARRAVRYPGRSFACLAIVVSWAVLLLACPWQLLLLPLSVAVSAPAAGVLLVSGGRSS